MLAHPARTNGLAVQKIKDCSANLMIRDGF
jgi:hypothetical protein